MSQLSKQVLSVLLVALVTGLLLWIGVQARSDALQEVFEDQRAESVLSLKHELQEEIARIQSMAQLFAHDQAYLIQRFYSNQDDQYIQRQFQQKIRQFFQIIILTHWQRRMVLRYGSSN